MSGGEQNKLEYWVFPEFISDQFRKINWVGVRPELGIPDVMLN